MATRNEHLAERIAKLEFELAEAKSNYDELLEHYNETVEFFEDLTEEHEILLKYLKPEGRLITAIIYGDDAIKIADMFNLRLNTIKE